MNDSPAEGACVHKYDLTDHSTTSSGADPDYHAQKRRLIYVVQYIKPKLYSFTRKKVSPW